MLIDEAKKWRLAEESRGNIGTRFIPRAITWLNEQRWSDHAALVAVVELAGPEIQIQAAVQCMPKSAVGRVTPARNPE
jgi:hypothetical protein